MMGNYYLVNRRQGWAAVCISKNACTSLKTAVLATRGITPKSKSEVHGTIGFGTDSEYLLPVSSGKPADLLTFAVWRDPVSRFLSNFRHFSVDGSRGRLEDWPCDLDEWIKRAEEELKKPVLEQDEHIRRQSDYYSRQDVDAVVGLSDLADWYRWRGWGEIPHENASSIGGLRLISEVQAERIRALYSADYTALGPVVDLSRDKPLVEGMWIGDHIPRLAQLCMRSYLDHGFRFRLWAYRQFRGIPEGVEVEDAGSILSPDKVYRHSSGSYSPFADWFRYQLLSIHGGLWTDMDVACLTSFAVGEEPWFASEGNGLASLGLVRFSAGHPLNRWLAQLSEDPCSPVPWDQREDFERKARLREEFRTVRELRINVPWGVTGPREFTKAVNYFDLQRFAAPSNSVYPVPWGVWRHSFDGTYSLEQARFSSSLGVHLWGEMLRREPDAMHNLSPESVFASLLERHPLPSVSASPKPPTHRPCRILVGICSCRPYTEKRQAVRDTWLDRKEEGIECVFFVGGDLPLEEEPDTVTLDVEDSYEALPEKVIAFFRSALQQYEFDWLFKCDDDTYVCLPRLWELTTLDGDFVGNSMLESRGSPSGGAGYLLSRQMVEALVNDPRLAMRGAEDVIIGEAAIRLGAVGIASPKLRWNAVPAPTRDNGQITAHWCSPERLKAIHAALTETPFRTIFAASATWKDHLFLYGNGTFLRKSSGCNGTWRKLEEGPIVLEWFDWPNEWLVLDGEDCGRVVEAVAPDIGVPGERWISVWHTYGDRGVPHLGEFLAKNPGVPVHVLQGELGRCEHSRHMAWRNCDRAMRNWWLETGRLLEFDRVAFLEWDVLFRQSLAKVFPPGDFVGREIVFPDSSPGWPWFRELNRLPASAKDAACGVIPLATMAISRSCLAAMMEHPLSEEMFASDLFCELRFPTLARVSGYSLAECKEMTPHVACTEVRPGNTSGVWHAVKRHS